LILRGKRREQATDAQRRKSAARPIATLLAVFLGLAILAVLSILGLPRAQTWGFQAWSLASWSFKPVQVRSPVLLGRTPAVWLERGEVTIARPPAEEPRRSDASGGGVRFADSILLRRAQLVINQRPAGAGSNEQDALALHHLLEPLQHIAFSRLAIRDGSGKVGRPAGGIELIEQLESDVVAAGKGLSAAKGSFRLRGERVAYEATFGSAILKDGLPALPLKLSLNGTLIEATFDGVLSFAPEVQAQGRLDLATSSVRRLAAWLGQELPAGLGLAALQAKGDASWRDGVLAYDKATLSLDGNAATGFLSLNLAQPRPMLDGTLALRQLDLQPYQSSEPTAAGEPVRTTLAAQLQGSDLRAPLLERLDADLRISAGRVTAIGFDTGKAVASLSLRAGKLVADVAELDLQDGTAAGQLVLETGPELARYRIKGGLSNASLGPLLARVAGVTRGSLEGRATVAFDLAGQGRTLDDLVKTLSGEARLAIGPGGKAGVQLRGLVSEARAKKAFEWTSQAKGETTFDELKADVAVRDGKLISEAVRAKSGGMTLIGDGTVNLTGSHVYLRLQIDEGPSLLSSRQDRATGLVLLGPWSSPTVKLEGPTAEPAQAPRPLLTGSTATSR
jgi:hypothetical protein